MHLNYWVRIKKNKKTYTSTQKATRGNAGQKKKSYNN